MVQLTATEAVEIDGSCPNLSKYGVGSRVRALEGAALPATGTEAQVPICGADGVPAVQTISGDITVNASGVTAIGSGKVTYGMLSTNNKRFVKTIRIAADSAASDTWERAAYYANTAVTVISAGVVPDTGFGQATNFASIAVQNKGTDGNGTTAIASKDFSSAVDDYVHTSLGTISNASVAAGEVLTFKATKTLTGQIIPAGLLVLVLERAA